MVMGASASALFTAVAGHLIDVPSLAMTGMMTALMLATVAIFALLVHRKQDTVRDTAAKPVRIDAAPGGHVQTRRRAA